MGAGQPCRTSAESDVPGTIKGAWFKPGEYGSVFSVSTSFSGWVLATFSKHAETGASFEIKVTPENITYLEPSKVTSEHCYQSYAQDGQKKDAVYVNLELLGPTDLQVEYGTGTCSERDPIETLTLLR